MLAFELFLPCSKLRLLWRKTENSSLLSKKNNKEKIINHKEQEFLRMEKINADYKWKTEKFRLNFSRRHSTVMLWLLLYIVKHWVTSCTSKLKDFTLSIDGLFFFYRNLCLKWMNITQLTHSSALRWKTWM